jgi:transcriptional regulator with XRE-family HTH domain
MNEKSQPKNSLADFILTAMRKQGLNQVELCKLTGVSQPVISRLLNKKNPARNIGVKNIYEILKKLDLLKIDEVTNTNIQNDSEKIEYLKRHLADKDVIIKLLKDQLRQYQDPKPKIVNGQ